MADISCGGPKSPERVKAFLDRAFNDDPGFRASFQRFPLGRCARIAPNAPRAEDAVEPPQAEIRAAFIRGHWTNAF